MTHVGRKNDSLKPRLDLIPTNPILEVGKVLTLGANLYGVNNWRFVPDGGNRYYAACLRHLLAYRQGEEIDPESGLSHLAHALTNIMFLMELK